MRSRYLFAMSIVAAGLIWSGEDARASNPTKGGPPMAQDTDGGGSTGETMSRGSSSSGVFSSTPDPNSPGGAKEAGKGGGGNMEIGKGRQGGEPDSGRSEPSGASAGKSPATASSSDSSSGSSSSGSSSNRTGAGSASDAMKPDQIDQKQGEQVGDKQVNNGRNDGESQNAKTIKGEVLRVEDDNYFVRGQDGTEVRLHTDKSTQMMGQLKKGDRFEAEVNEQNHALSIRQTPQTSAQ